MLPGTRFRPDASIGVPAVPSPQAVELPFLGSGDRVPEDESCIAPLQHINA